MRCNNDNRTQSNLHNHANRIPANVHAAGGGTSRRAGQPLHLHMRAGSDAGAGDSGDGGCADVVGKECAMKLLDLFCGGGGTAMGFHRAGFDEIVGIDIKPQKRYPFEFVQGDALEYLAKYGYLFDLIVAGPPCQAYSVTRAIHKNKHPELIDETRRLLIASGKPYVIENVPGAPLINPLMLCGTMFGLGVIRHRLFECSPVIWFPPMQCNHNGKAQALNQIHEGRRAYKWIKDTYKFISISGHSFSPQDGAEAIDIDWMTRDELSQAIPPAYTEFVGNEMIKMLKVQQ